MPPLSNFEPPLTDDVVTLRAWRDDDLERRFAAFDNPEGLLGSAVGAARCLAVMAGVVGAITIEPEWALARLAAFASDLRDRVAQRDELGAVVPVAAVRGTASGCRCLR